MTSITKEWKAGTPAPGWRELLVDEFRQPYMQELVRFLDQDRAVYTLFPEPKNIFRAYTLTDYQAVKVVILGQDPYHGAGQANGLAFSVFPGVEVPPSLRNIYQEIATDCGAVACPNGNLDAWATQGVFLINTVLTVRSGQSNSHHKRGWENFTGRTIELLAERKEPLVFMLWGSNARQHAHLVDRDRHLVLEAPHPSPLSAHRGFFGCRHFTKANQFLQAHGIPPIIW